MCYGEGVIFLRGKCGKSEILEEEGKRRKGGFLLESCSRISRGVYEYKGYRISNCGYHHPDHCIWWEAVNIETGWADYHATTKREIIDLINEGE